MILNSLILVSMVEILLKEVIPFIIQSNSKTIMKKSHNIC